jgi:hypothetical protein
MALSEPFAPPAAAAATRTRRQRLLGGGTDGNEQLTAVAGVILLIAFLVIAATIIWIGHNFMLWLHLFLGVVLVGPLLVKLASTGYRFMRYYTADPAYRRKGPPHPLMRVLGPFLIIDTVGIFFTGLLLLLAGPGTGGLVPELHKIMFYVWIGLVSIHVLWHLPELPSAVRAVHRGQRESAKAASQTAQAPASPRELPGSRGRGAVLLAALAGGLVLALIFLPDIHSWTAGLAYHPHSISLN